MPGGYYLEEKQDDHLDDFLDDFRDGPLLAEIAYPRPVRPAQGELVEDVIVNVGKGSWS